ncbi:Verru_Chthon cassette protein B [Verrucomicrobium sp. BvORR106]|uniref:Verru_Chthon cassette protein B n=1 Tax=Verrucomicrobium sp. BvORR106 TaxID=1403819 RepID=UPI0009DED73E|nr:Verru_Chthon cassette protein B [Verrucomicrobium sp. BvORR106]
MTTRTRHPHARSAAGATLVEVVITIGILVTVMVPLVGLLSASIETSGRAASTTVSARIASRLIGEVQQADWSLLQNWQEKDTYLDDQGMELTTGSPQENSVYTARVRLSTTSGVTLGTVTGQPANTWQRQVVVMVASRPGTQGKTVLDQAEAALDNGKSLPRSVRVSRSLLVNLEKTL